MTLRAFIAGASLCLIGQTAMAEKSLADLVAESVGYVQVRDGVILIEDDYDEYICRMTASDAAFDAKAAGQEIPAGALSSTCILLEEFDKSGTPAFAEKSLADLVAESVGYAHVRDGVVMIEDDYDEYVCRMDASDAAFDAKAAGQEIPAGSLTSTCILLEEFDK
jgi:hypothetical protein